MENDNSASLLKAFGSYKK